MATTANSIIPSFAKIDSHKQRELEGFGFHTSSYPEILRRGSHRSYIYVHRFRESGSWFVATSLRLPWVRSARAEGG